jgi:hypothetical protein
MSDPQANHYGHKRQADGGNRGTHDGGRAAAVALLYELPTVPGKVMFLTFLPESCALILLQQIRIFVVPASAFTYRLTARVFETLDFDKRQEQEGQNYGE